MLSRLPTRRALLRIPGHMARCRRRGLSTLEVVLSTGVMMPFAVALYFVGKQACGRLFQIIQSLVAWPYL